MTTRGAVLAVLFAPALAGCAAHTSVSVAPPAAPTPQDIQQEFQPDRPDVANGTHVVPIGLAQLETGGEFAHVESGHDVGRTPFSVRLGLRSWLEARLESFAFVDDRDASRSVGLSGLSTGAKVRLAPAFAFIAAVNLPVGTQPEADYLLTLVTGTDLGGSNHVDVNYGIAAIASDERSHFLQQWLVVSANRQVTDRFSPYAEVYWYSHEAPNGPRDVSTDFGFVYTVNERFAFDCGADVGLSSGAPRGRIFAGLSVIVGEAFGHAGVHGRLKEAAERRLGGKR